MVRWVGDGGREIRRGPDVDVDAAGTFVGGGRG